MDIYKQLVSKYGHDAQLNQLTEEVAELLVAVNKMRREDEKGKLTTNHSINVLTEIVDVKIMLEQLIVIMSEKFDMDFNEQVEIELKEKLEIIKKKHL